MRGVDGALLFRAEECPTVGLGQFPCPSSSDLCPLAPWVQRVRRRWSRGGSRPPSRQEEQAAQRPRPGSQLAALRTSGEAEGRAGRLDIWATFSSQVFLCVKLPSAPLCRCPCARVFWFVLGTRPRVELPGLGGARVCFRATEPPSSPPLAWSVFVMQPFRWV